MVTPPKRWLPKNDWTAKHALTQRDFANDLVLCHSLISGCRTGFLTRLD